MAIDKELLKGSTVTLILKMLDRQPTYGYELIKKFKEGSHGVFAFKEGTLYPILHSLESTGMVESYWVEEPGTRRRKYYRLTEKGRRRLKEKKAEWAIFRGAMDQVLGEGRV